MEKTTKTLLLSAGALFIGASSALLSQGKTVEAVISGLAGIIFLFVREYLKDDPATAS